MLAFLRERAEDVLDDERIKILETFLMLPAMNSGLVTHPHSILMNSGHGTMSNVALAMPMGGGDGLVGQRISAGPDNISVLIIASPDANMHEISAHADRAADHLMRLQPGDTVMVLDQEGYPQTFIPPEYHIGVVQAVNQRMGGVLSTIKKEAAPITSKAGGGRGGNGG